jgi:hypothetical protein
MTEDDLQQHVVHLMHAHGLADVCWFAVPNGEARSAATGAKLKRQGVKPGAPDLVFLIKGTFHGVELKAMSGVMSQAQKDFGPWIETAGGVYHVCWGLDQSFRCLQKIGAIDPQIRFTHPTSPPPERRRAAKIPRAP